MHGTFFEVRHPRCFEPKLQNGKNTVKTQLYIYRVSQEECAKLREGVPYVKVY